MFLTSFNSSSLLRCSILKNLFSTTANGGSIWSQVPLGPRDPILGITEAYKADTSPKKINLGVGAYRDDQGKPYILQCVQKAEEQLNTIYKDKEYADISGLKEFCDVSAQLAYGTPSPVPLDQIAVMQSLSGTGALRLGGVFLSRFAPGSGRTVYIPTPTWGNHSNIFKDSGLNCSNYRYWDTKSNGLDLAGMLQDISQAPSGSTILLHACAHNPTGVDPAVSQWEEICRVIKDKKHIAFFDMAYQGFASGDTEKDASAMRYFVKQGIPCLVAQSYAKNFGLYGERVGAFSIPCNTPSEAAAVLSQLKMIARPMYSNPPVHGARIVTAILKSAELKQLWFKEVKIMADRIIKMRKELRTELETLGSHLSWNHMTDQIGMFCYTGLKTEQVQQLTDEHHVYLTKDGRISMAGVNSSNVKALAMAIHSVTNGK